jgi:hypothetical protein
LGRDRQLFEQNETARLAQLNEEIKKKGPLSGLGCLGFIVAALVVGSAQGAAAGWWIIFLVVIIVGAFSSAEEQFRRWRYKAVLVRRVFNEPEPVYQPPRENRQTPPHTEERQEPPPRSGADGRITSMRQAYEILGLPSGRITLHTARTAYRTLVTEYHSDKVAHLGPELRELAHRKTLELNLAMQFIEEHVTSGQPTTEKIVDKILRLKNAFPFVPFSIKTRKNELRADH